MTEIEQAMASLKHLVECRCDEAYTGRGRHDPHSACDYAEDVKIVSDHVGAIEVKMAKALSMLAAIGSAQTSGGGQASVMAFHAREALAEIKGENK
jgi:hypothetical protein